MTQPSETETGQPAESDAETTEPDDATTDTDPETFPRSVVEELRRENAEQRVKAKHADDLARRLHLALTTATGRLADPTDLPFDEVHVDDPAALTVALDELLGRKPHLASRRPSGDVGQGATGQTDSVDLAGILRARAG